MRALIAMSGGVDSSVAAALLKEKGYECVGVTMQLFDARRQSGASSDDVQADARGGQADGNSFLRGRLPGDL